MDKFLQKVPPTTSSDSTMSSSSTSSSSSSTPNSSSTASSNTSTSATPSSSSATSTSSSSATSTSSSSSTATPAITPSNQSVNGTGTSEVYCICRTSDCEKFMIACDKCDEWFHGDCVGISESEGYKMENYTCVGCKEKKDEGTPSKRPAETNNAPASPSKKQKTEGSEAPTSTFQNREDITQDVSKMSLEELKSSYEKLKLEIEALEKDLGMNKKQRNVEYVHIDIPEHCVPIRADVRAFDFAALGEAVQFDAIVMDPPWKLAGAAPTRGVALGYSQLPDNDIQDIPIPKLQKAGFIFIWVINSRYRFALDLMKRWGYKLVDDITWVKATVNRRLAKGHGFYLQHAKETCLIGKKGDDPPGMQSNVGSDVIFSERRGQSQKPEEIYELIEKLIPSGNYLEIFARRNNLRDYWVSIGLEL